MKKAEIFFLPYLSIEKPHKIGKVLFWPYHKFKNEYLKNVKEALSRFDKMVERYRSFYNDRPIKTIVVATLEDNPKLKPLSKEQMELISDAINLFAYIRIHQIQRHSALFFDNYIFHRCSINLDKDTGGLNLQSRRGFNFVELDKITFQTPHHIFIELADRNYSEEFAKSLNNLFLLANSSVEEERKEARRIIRAIKWFNQSKYIEPLITNEINFVSMGVALETLLGIQRFSRKSEELSHNIQLLLGESKNIKNWTESFYKRRSQILHGEKVKTLYYGEQSSHILLAQIVFDHCLKTKLYLMKLWPYDVSFRSILLENIDYYLGNNKERIGKLLEFNLQQLQKRQEAIKFERLGWTINTDTDLSGDKEFYKKSIQTIAKLIKEGLENIEKQAAKYKKEIKNFDSVLEALKKTIKEIVDGKIELVKDLKAIDVFCGKPEDIKFKVKIKHLQIGYGMLITDFYIILNELYELYERRKYRY